MVAFPLNSAVGKGLTVTIADPVKSEGIEVQLASCKVEIEYVVVTAGLTVIVIGLLAPLNAAPVDKVPFHGPVPVRFRLRVADRPEHIEVVPVITPVGLGLTVTRAEPVPLFTQPLESSTLVIV